MQPHSQIILSEGHSSAQNIPLCPDWYSALGGIAVLYEFQFLPVRGRKTNPGEIISKWMHPILKVIAVNPDSISELFGKFKNQMSKQTKN